MAGQTTSVRTEARTVHITPRKTRLVIDLVRGKSAAEALAVLQLAPRAVSPIVKKVLRSAITNTEHSYGPESANLYVFKVYVNGGMTPKRFRPCARDTASPVNRRTSHVAAVISEMND